MTFPSYERLARLYQTRMARLFKAAVLEHPEMAREPEFQAAVWNLARGMVGEVARANANSWRQAVTKSTRARQIFTALRSEIARTGLQAEIDRIASRNARLISSLPADVAEQVTAHAAKLHQRGARAAEVENEIRGLAPKLASSRIRLIARTEISRAETDLTRARSEGIGIRWYQWTTSEDQRVRPSHRKMDLVLVSWSEAPSPEALIGEASTLGHYHAGSCPNCRCVALPLADLNEISWPARVYTGGRLVRMSRVQFVRSAGIQIAA